MRLARPHCVRRVVPGTSTNMRQKRAYKVRRSTYDRWSKFIAVPFSDIDERVSVERRG